MITIIMLVVVVGMKMLVIMLIMVLLYEKQNNVDIPTLKKNQPRSHVNFVRNITYHTKNRTKTTTCQVCNSPHVV